MSNELIKKAYEDHNGAWPYSGHDSVVISTKLNPHFDEGVYYFTSANTKREMDLLTNGEAWQWVGTKADFDAYGESLKEEWTPEVDVRCLGSVPDKELGRYSYVEVVPLRDLGSEWVVQVVGGGRLSYCDEFRPLKTESEKQADAMFGIVKDATDLYHACELLRDAGYKND